MRLTSAPSHRISVVRVLDEVEPKLALLSAVATR
jgi:hypothetical protein